MVSRAVGVVSILLFVLACENPGSSGEGAASNAESDSLGVRPVPASTPALPAATPEALDSVSGDEPGICPIHSTGIGPVRVGMTLGEAQAAFPRALFERADDAEGIPFASVSVEGDDLMVLYAEEEDASSPLDLSKPIVFAETFNRRCYTAEGVGPGALIVDVERVLGKTKRIILSEVESREYIEFENQPGHFRFRLDYTGVFPAGERETVAYAPGARIFSVTVLEPRLQ